MAKATLEPRKCERCGRYYSPKPGERSPKNWAKRRFCSHECYRAVMNGTGKWNVRAVRTCPICGEEFTRLRETHNVVTCGKEECHVRYRREVAGPKRSATMRRQYASGERVPSGASERLLWPFLNSTEWIRGLQWTDSWGTFQLDFADLARKLNVELDGPDHKLSRRRRLDQARDAELTRRGWKILRIPNSEVDTSPEDVAKRILAWASQ